MAARFNKEFSIGSVNNVVVKYGSVNRLDPKTLYIYGKCWIRPRQDNPSYKLQISKVEKGLRNAIEESIGASTALDLKYILDFNINHHLLSTRDKKFLDFEIHLRQKEREEPKGLCELGDTMTRAARHIANELGFSLEENGFSVDPTR